MTTIMARSASFTSALKGGRPLILVVDDDDKSRKLAAEFLGVRGFDMAEAGDGEECLLQVARRRPDLILLDMQMPRLGGIATLRRLKNDTGMAAIPVVMLSASAMPDEQEQMRAAGCVAVLSKPVDLKELLTTVQEHLNAEVGSRSAGVVRGAVSGL